jgi:hypothetical protein
MPKVENNLDLKNVSSSEKPPLFRNWNCWYLIVLANLTLLILFFYLLTKLFS